MNVLEQIAPETLAQLSTEEKRELILILEAMEMPRLERLFERIEKSRKLPPDPNALKVNLADVLREAQQKREEWEHKHSREEIAARDAQEDKDLDDLMAWRMKKRREEMIARGLDPDWKREDAVLTPRREQDRSATLEIPATPATPAPIKSSPAVAPHAGYVDVPLRRKLEPDEQPDEHVVTKTTDNRAYVSRYDADDTMKNILEREKVWRENHPVLDGEWRWRN